MSAEALQQQQLAALTQQQPQQHMQQLALPPLTQDQLLHHMISQQVIQAPLGPSFQQPLHQLLPQVSHFSQSSFAWMCVCAHL